MFQSRKAQMGLILTIIAIVVVGVVFYLYNSSLGYSGSDSGRVVFGITDAAADMGAVSKLVIQIDKVEAHSTTEGWVTITSSSKSYDLLELKSQGKLAVLADTNVKTGSYDRFRLDISKVEITDDNGTHQAKLPSGELKVNAQIDVNENSTATAKFDFIADESLHITGNGKYILAPVLQIETKSDAKVKTEGDTIVEINGGKSITNIKVGMDINGNTGAGLGIPVTADLEIGADGVIGKGKASSDSIVNVKLK